MFICIAKKLNQLYKFYDIDMIKDVRAKFF